MAREWEDSPLGGEKGWGVTGSGMVEATDGDAFALVPQPTTRQKVIQ